MPKPITGWAVINRRFSRGGFFYRDGVSPTRSLAIARHVRDYDQELYEAGYPAAYARRLTLSDLQKRVWRNCKARGDEVIKVHIQPLASGDQG